MTRKDKLTKMSRAIYSTDNGRSSVPGNGHHCPSPKSPTGSHWWQIDSPDGEVSVGVCRYCDEPRKFATTLEKAIKISSRGKK